MKLTRRVLAFVLILVLLLTNSGVTALAEAVLTMPTALQIIDEEAFYGSTSIDKVVLSNNVTEIRARAFANSTLSEINLPDSLTFIDPSAFDGPEKVTVTANPGTYAYDWAVANHYIDDTALRVTVTCSAETAVLEESVTWTAEGVNGVAPYKYRFYLYCDGTRIATRAYNASNTYTYKFTKAGTYYVAVSLKDDDGEIAETTSPEIVVSLETLKINSVVCDKETIRTTDTATWTATASGGEQPYQYSFALKLNGETIDSQEYSASDSYSYTFENEGAYQLEVTAKDNLNAISAIYSVPVQVALRPVEITGITADANSAVTESTITWTVSTIAGKAPFTYSYEVKVDGVTVATGSASESNTFTYNTENAGSCVLTVTVTDGAGNQAQQDSATISITTKALTIDAITAESEWVKVGDTINWAVTAIGGVKPLKYAFDVYIDGEEMDGRSFKDDNTYSYEPDEAGDYTAKVRVRDAANTTVELESAVVHVYDPIQVVSITPDKTSVQSGEAVTWAAFVIGGKGLITYDWYVYNGDTLEYTERNTQGAVLWAPLMSGTYTAKVIITDEEGETDDLTGGSVTSSAHAATPQSAFTFSILNGSYCSLTGYTGTDTAVIMPGEWTDDNGVTRIVQTIGNNAFKNNKNITSVIIADSVETMGSNVFDGCSNLVYIKGGINLTNIGNYAFQNCVNLRGYDFEPTTATMGSYAFYGCTSITSFEGWNGLTNIGAYAFYRSQTIESFNWPETVK